MTDESSERTWLLPDEPAPVRLMCTIWADTDGVHDELQAPRDVEAWLDAIGTDRDGARATDAELLRARELRDAVRRLAAYVTEDDRPTAAVCASTGDLTQAVDAVNAAANRLPVHRLAVREGRLERVAGTDVSRVTAGLAGVAEQSRNLFDGERAQTLRACHAPGCALYFVKTHPRREWCSVTCGNRARAARHYQHVREARGRRSDA